MREAPASEREALASWSSRAPFLHNHVGWLDTSQWIGRPATLELVSAHDRPQALLVAAPDQRGTVWVHHFASARAPSPWETWPMLWAEAVRLLRAGGHARAWVMTTQSWLSGLLLSSGFNRPGEVVTLAHSRRSAEPNRASPATLRPMSRDDLPAVCELDGLAFRPPWQMDMEALQVTFAQAVAGTVALVEGRIVGYQLSTRAQGKMHLARVAVHPQAQRLGIGRALVQGVIPQSVQQGQGVFTVNTQSDNAASLRLYHSLGFMETGEVVPLFCAQLGE